MNSCHGMEDFNMDPKRIKKGYLTQSDIDNPLPPVSRHHSSWREVLEYLDTEPGGVMTTIVALVLFALVSWGLYSLFAATELIKITAGRG